MSDELFFSTHDPRLGLSPRKWGAPVWLQLQRYADTVDTSVDRASPPVLLLHGGSANHGTFIVPARKDETSHYPEESLPEQGLDGWLLERGFDPWLLDWSGSSLVVDHPENQTVLLNHPDLFTFNRAALEDVPAAMAMMRLKGVRGPISAVGHCMGAAV